MIIYIESNFVLELVFQQEQCENCRKILEFCKKDMARLIIPSFCVSEPFDTIVRRSKSREELSKKLNEELLQISRSKPYQEKVNALQEVTSLLVQPNEEERDNLYQEMEEILSIARTIDINPKILRSAGKYRTEYGFRPQDSIVYASVIFHAKGAGAEKKCFITRDKHFENTDISEEMKAFNCRVFQDFVSVYGYISSQ